MHFSSEECVHLRDDAFVSLHLVYTSEIPLSVNIQEKDFVCVRIHVCVYIGHIILIGI